MKQGLPVLLCILDILFQADFVVNLYTNGGTVTQVLQIIFHGMSEMKSLHDQYLFKKKCATEIFEYVPEYCQLLVYCRI